MGFWRCVSPWCGAVTELSKHPTQSSIEMSLSIDSLWALPSSTLSRVFTYTHSDSLLGLIVFPVFFLSLSPSIHPVLVTMATGETQSQYLLAASVTQPSTRIAGSCFCVCLTFPSLKSNASGQGRCARSVWLGTPPLRQSSGTSSLCICVRVCARVSLSALQRCTNKFSLCQNSQGGKRIFYKPCYREFCFAVIYFGLFLGLYVAYTFQDFCQHN